MQQEPFLVRIARQWGWRAYAIPVLLVLTVVIVADIFRTPEEGFTDTSHTSSQSSSGKPGPVPGEDFLGEFDAGDLPPGPDFPTESTGEFSDVTIAQEAVGRGTELPVTYSVEIETSVGPGLVGGADAFAATVNSIFADSRGWIADPRYSFEAVPRKDNPTMVVQLVATKTAHEICGTSLEMEVSCYLSPQQEGDPGRVLISVARWVRGALAFSGDLGLYRQYVVNHEVGHGLGYAAHEPCPVDGGIAPIMMQQTLSVSNDELYEMNPNEVYRPDGKTCVPNGWPYTMGEGDAVAAPTQEAR